MNNSFQLSYSYATANKGQLTPFLAQYEFSKTFNVDESKLPFVKPIVLFNKTPLATAEGCMHFFPYYYSTTHYWEIYGDSTLIYKGEDPSNNYKSDAERVQGNFNSSLCSKWFYGSFGYTIGSDSYEIKESFISSVKTYYDLQLVETLPGAYVYNWKCFECSAIDAIGSSQVQGTGTLRVSTMTEVSEGSWAQIIETTKNVTQTAPLFEDVTHITVKEGFWYLNGSYNGYLNDFTVKFTGVVTSIFPQADAGNADLVYFGYNWSSSDGTQYWRLWWDNKRARSFACNTGLRTLSNFPRKEDYQTNSLPYTSISFKQNQSDDYPLKEPQTTSTALYSTQQKIWIKNAERQFTLIVKGISVLSSNALQEYSVEVQQMNENYIVSGDTYVRESENRENKLMPMYKPTTEDIKAKSLVSFINPISETRNINEEI